MIAETISAAALLHLSQDCPCLSFHDASLIDLPKFKIEMHYISYCSSSLQLHISQLLVEGGRVRDDSDTARAMSNVSSLKKTHHILGLPVEALRQLLDLLFQIIAEGLKVHSLWIKFALGEIQQHPIDCANLLLQLVASTDKT